MSIAISKAIEILETQLYGTPEDLEEYGSYICALAVKEAINALKKRVPQCPTIENGFVKCPSCKKYIRLPIADKYNNCPECGQALKWEDKE